MNVIHYVIYFTCFLELYSYFTSVSFHINLIKFIITRHGYIILFLFIVVCTVNIIPPNMTQLERGKHLKFNRITHHHNAFFFLLYSYESAQQIENTTEQKQQQQQYKIPNWICCWCFENKQSLERRFDTFNGIVGVNVCVYARICVMISNIIRLELCCCLYIFYICSFLYWRIIVDTLNTYNVTDICLHSFSWQWKIL